MNVLVGHTGFVGNNLYRYGSFELGVNSGSVREAYGTKPDLCVYAGLRAEKYLANQQPEKDWQMIEQAKENIRMIKPQKLVLISTIDVFKSPVTYRILFVLPINFFLVFTAFFGEEYGWKIG